MNLIDTLKAAVEDIAGELGVSAVLDTVPDGNRYQQTIRQRLYSWVAHHGLESVTAYAMIAASKVETPGESRLRYLGGCMRQDGARRWAEMKNAEDVANGEGFFDQPGWRGHNGPSAPPLRGKANFEKPRGNSFDRPMPTNKGPANNPPFENYEPEGSIDILWDSARPAD